MSSLDVFLIISCYMLIPVVIVIALLAMKMPSIPVILFGAFLGTIWAALFQGVPFLEAFNVLYSGGEIASGVEFIDELLNRGGFESMIVVIVLILFDIRFGGFMVITSIL